MVFHSRFNYPDFIVNLIERILTGLEQPRVFPYQQANWLPEPPMSPYERQIHRMTGGHGIGHIGRKTSIAEQAYYEVVRVVRNYQFVRGIIQAPGSPILFLVQIPGFEPMIATVLFDGVNIRGFGEFIYRNSHGVIEASRVMPTADQMKKVDRED